MEVCRACLSSDKNLMPLKETFIDGYNLLTNLNIKPSDGMPQCACEPCVTAVNYFVDFRERCIQSESSLQQKLLENIKLEKEESADSQINEDIAKSLEKKYDPQSKKEHLPKRPRGRPRKDITASETQKPRRGRPRKNKNNIAEVKGTTNPLLESEIILSEVKGTANPLLESEIILSEVKGTANPLLESEIILSEVKETPNPLLESEIIISPDCLLASRLNQNCDLGLDYVKEEIKYEYIEDSSVIDNDNSLDSDINLKKLDDSNTPDYLEKEEDLPDQPITIEPSKGSVVNETDFPCGLCEKHFQTQHCISSHLDNHKNDSKCGTCHATFPEWPALLAHRMEHIPNKSHQCHICHRRVYSIEAMEYHYLSMHLKKNLQDIKLSCKLCTKAFPTPKKLKRHIATHAVKKKYICDHCSKAFRTKTTLKIHLQLHSEEKQYVCGTCGFSCRQSNNLKGHILRKHTATRVYCTGCDGVFPNKERLQQHACRQRDKICSVCGKEFLRTKILRRHMESHSDVCKYKCELCPAAFKTRNCFVAHTNRHRGDRPFACSDCPKRFFTAQHLNKHKRIHTGVRPYVCQVCSKAFNTNYNLKFHMKVHGEYLVAHRNKLSEDPENAKSH